jgi:Flp pilus assembly pilin Flp
MDATLSKEIRMLKFCRKLARCEKGASMVEYTVLLGLMLAVTIGTLTTVGTDLGRLWTVVSGDVGTAATNAEAE